MSSATVVLVSDTHLGRDHAYFQDNWEAFLAEMEALKPDLVIHAGDVSFNGPDVADDIHFAKEQIARLAVPWVAIPGNHDIGEPGDNPRLMQPITAARLSVWQEAFGTDRHVLDVGGWRLVLLNSELLGSGMDEERLQWQMLTEALSGAGDRPLALILHKPLFLMSPDEAEPNGSCVHPGPRRPVLALAREHGVRFVASGHLHTWREFELGGIDFVWAPTTAFIKPGRFAEAGGIARAGYVIWHFEGARYSAEYIQPPLFVNYDITNWSERKGSSISLPPLPHRPSRRPGTTGPPRAFRSVSAAGTGE